MVSAVPRKPVTRKRVLLAIGPGQSPERRAGIARYATEAGWILDCRLSAHLAQGHSAAYLASTPIDGCISMMARTSAELQPLVASLDVPVVDLWHDYPEMKCPRVLQDHHAIGRAGAMHLMERGLENLLFFTHTVDRRVALIRQEGFVAAARAQTGVRHVTVSELSWGPETPLAPGDTRLSWLGRVLSRMDKPLGVMAVNDAVASEVIDAAILAGLNVPEDVAVVGVDNDPIVTELGAIPLSSVDNARERLGYEAAALLDKMMSGAVPPAERVLIPPAGVVMRRSSDVIAIADANIRQAAQFIRDHFREPISVDDVVATSFLSRRRLQDLFREALGHGMSEEILRQRMLCSQHLLVNTEHKIERIAQMAGFGGGMRMSKVYQRELRMTPQQYRLRYRSSLARN